MLNNEQLDVRYDSVRVSRTFGVIKDLFGLPQKKVLDLGCGYGEYLALCGPGSVGITTTQAEIDHAKTLGLNVRYGNVEQLEKISLDDDFDIIWANNLLEHLLSPHAFLMKLKMVSGSKTRLILGVPIRPRFGLLKKFSLFRGYLASNHINFFTQETLVLTVEKAGWLIEETSPFISRYCFVNWLASFLSPHIYIVARNDRSFAYPPKKIKEWESDSYYQYLFDLTKK